MMTEMSTLALRALTVEPWSTPANREAVLTALGALAYRDEVDAPTAARFIMDAIADEYDSFDREMSFSLACKLFGFEYEAIYNAWLASDGR